MRRITTPGTPIVRPGGRAGVLALLAALALAAPAAAREPVDPGTLNPPPPDFFNADCERLGNGITCTLAFDDPSIDGDPSGIVCGGTELTFTQSRSVVGKRFYDADGNLLQRHFRETMWGTIDNPATGRGVTWSQHDTVKHDLAVPGDLDTGTIRFTGLMTRAWLPGGGSVLLAAGTQVQDAATGAILREGGPHPFDRYFGDGDASALQPLCDALD